MFKDPLLVCLLAFATGFLVINPLGQLSPLENKVRLTLISLYNRAHIQNNLDENKKKIFMKQWKDMIQPKNNKMKVYRIYLVTNLSLPIFLAFSLKVIEVSLVTFREIRLLNLSVPLVLKLMVNMLDVFSQNFALYVVRFLQELLVLKVASLILQSFADYHTFLYNSRKIWMVKVLCYATVLNLRTVIGFSKVCYFGPVYTAALVGLASIVLLFCGNLKNNWIVNKLNYVVQSLV